MSSYIIHSEITAEKYSSMIDTSLPWDTRKNRIAIRRLCRKVVPRLELIQL